MSHPSPVAVAAKPGLPYKWLALITVCVGTFMSVLDSSVVNIALPTISRSLHTELGVLQWVVTSYLLVITSTLFVFGRLGDMYGRKRVYVFGFVLFALGSGLCGLAQNVAMLIAFRVLQGVGSAMMMAIGNALGAGAFPQRERGKALGFTSMVVASAATLGPTLGGFLVDVFDWRTAFFLRLPFAVLGILLGVYILHKDEPAPRGQRFDLIGASSLAGTLLLLMLVVTQGERVGWASPLIFVVLGATIAAAVTFLAAERRAFSPLMELSLLRNRLFVSASSASLLSFMASSSTALLMPFYLQQTLGYPASQAGLMLIPQPILMAVLAPFAGWLSDRLGSRLLASTGVGLICLGLVAVATLGPDATYVDVLLRVTLLGMGQGLFSPPNNSAIMGSVSRDKLGVASSAIATMRNLGMTLGTATAATLFTSRLAFHLAEGASGGLAAEALDKAGRLAAFHDAVLVGAAICSVGVFASLVRGGRAPAGDALAASRP